MHILCMPIKPAVRPTLIRQIDTGSLTNVRTQLGGRRTLLERGVVPAQTSLHKSWLGGTEKSVSLCPARGIGPSVFRFEFRRSNHWAKEINTPGYYSLWLSSVQVAYKWVCMPACIEGHVTVKRRADGDTIFCLILWKCARISASRGRDTEAGRKERI